MTSEIRTNSITSRAGMSTVTMTDSGPMFSGITTFVDNSGFTFGVGGGTSIFTPATNVLTFGTNNTEKIRIDASGHMHGVGVITATHFYGDGSNLTGMSAGTSLSGSTNNTVCTVTGANAIQGESNLTFDGTSLKIGNNFSPHSEGDNLVIGGSGWQGMTIYGEGGGGVIQFADDGNNRIGQILYNHGDNSMSFRVNGNQTRLRINSNGAVGINTTNYSSVLNNEVGLAIHGSSNDNCRINLSTPNKSNTLIGYYGLSNRFGVDVHNGLEIRDVEDSYATRLLIFSNGDISCGGAADNNIYNDSSGGGINFKNGGQLVIAKQASSGADPLVWLNDTGQTTNKFLLFAQDGTEKASIGLAGNDLRFARDGYNETFRITSSGRFGVGTASPDHIFEVEDNNSSIAVSRSGANAQLLFKSNSVAQAGQIQVSESSGGGVMQFFNKNTSGTLRECFRLSPTNRTVSFFASGPSYPAGSTNDEQYYQFANSYAYNWIMKLRNYTWGYGLRIDVADDTTREGLMIYSDKSGVNQAKASIIMDGTFRSRNNTYTSYSDIKLKENIVDAGSQWDDIKGIKVRNFNFKIDDPSQKMLGVVAQEVETICPNLVRDIPDREEKDGEIRETGTHTKEVKYSILYMKAIKALQEAMTRIETLEQDNIALRARVTNLEGN